jgi:hypothetical protein
VIYRGQTLMEAGRTSVGQPKRQWTAPQKVVQVL